MQVQVVYHIFSVGLQGAGCSLVGEGAGVWDLQVDSRPQELAEVVSPHAL